MAILMGVESDKKFGNFLLNSFPRCPRHWGHVSIGSDLASFRG